jgi:hypothetical protein
LISFVNPIFLAGLTLAAAPVLLHLLRRDAGRRVTFPATMLLTSSGDVRVRRWSLAEILLLALRVLVIAGFVLSLARPRLAVTGVGRDESVLASVAIVVDDTPSMGATISGMEGARGPTRMAEARRAVAEILDRLEPGSRVRIQAASGLLLDAGVDLEEARRVAKGLRAVDVARPMGNALADSVAWLGNEPSPNELYVVSDFQRSSWAQGEADCRGFGGPVYVVDVGEGSFDNWAVSGVRVTEPRVHRGLLFEMAVEVTATSSGTRDLIVELEGGPPDRERIEVRRERVRLAAGEWTELTFEVATQEAGPLAGVARLVRIGGIRGAGAAEEGDAADDWPADDSRVFAVQVSPAAEILCVGAGTGDGSLAAEIVSRALAPFPGGERELARVDVTSPPLAARRELDPYDCVVLASPSALGPADWDILRTFVEEGGGLLALADESMAQDKLPPAAGDLLPAAAVRVRAPPSRLRLRTLDYEHPVLRGFEHGENGNIEGVRFRTFVALDGCDDGDVLAWFGGAREGEKPSPALVEGRRGRGRTLLLASGLTARWSTFFKEPAFVPFLHETVAYLARSEPAELSALAGTRVTVMIHPAERGLSARLEERAVSPPTAHELAVDADRLEVHLGRLDRRGVYHLVTNQGVGAAPTEARGGRERAVAVELDPRELESERVRPQERLHRRVLLARSRGELASVYARTRGGSEVTAHVAWATLAVFLAEMLLSARLTKRRSGSRGQAANIGGAI